MEEVSCPFFDSRIYEKVKVQKDYSGHRGQDINGIDKNGKQYGVAVIAPCAIEITFAGRKRKEEDLKPDGTINQRGPWTWGWRIEGIMRDGPFNGLGIRMAHFYDDSHSEGFPNHIKNAVNSGKSIPRGTVLGAQGISGNVTGAHVHVEILVNNDYSEKKVRYIK